ncbi:MAG: ThuA domain-containing protein [Planctomycetes bacterium]|nr:ThuA domain-containing protein [Planctomycetota bacterium]MCH9777147.1 ThuA domain-containing protein [Planctomycetota bacterium]MCH9790872.1 ThuA domain-containing protein [Planctomycetota bacterium]
MLNRGFLKYTFCLFAFFSFCGLTCFSLSGQEKQSEKQAASPADQPLIVFMIGEEGYKTSESLPAFAKAHLQPLGFRTQFVFADKQDPNSFPGLDIIKQADLLFLSVRRKTLPTAQMKLIREYLDSGKPLMALRTTSHGFSLSKGQPADGYVEWKDFDKEVLGGEYAGDFNNKTPTDVTTQLRAEQDPIMATVRNKYFRSKGSMYKSINLKRSTKILLRGLARVDGQPVQMPVAWTNTSKKSRVFYTSLGHLSDFKSITFTHTLVNAVYWCLKQTPPQVDVAGKITRNRFKKDIAANAEVDKVMKSFKGRGEVGDESDPTPPEEAVKLFQVHQDFEMESIASEPEVMQPLYMSFDHRGRMWVVQYLQYPFPAGLKVIKYDQYLRAVFDKVPPPPPNHFKGADKISVLEDTNGDGSFDKVKDVITGLNIVSAVTVGKGGIWVLNPPYLLFYPDANGDDIPDGDPEVHLSGFGLEDTHSVANSIKWGPDGWLYGANGSTTTGTVSSAVTKRVHFKGQMIWRYHPETKIFEIYAEGGGNTFSVEIDSKGRVFSGTNNGSTRGMHYAQGGYAKKNWGKHGPLTNSYAFGYYEHMRHKGYMERFSQTFSIYEGGTFPAKYNGAVFAANSLHNRVMASQLIPDTSTYRTEDMPPIVLTQDRWFRPVDIKVGPDGCVYLADWYDSRLTHVDPRDNWHKTSGRIYRLKPNNFKPLKPFDLSKQTNEELLTTLGHTNKWFRQKAVQVIGERADQSMIPSLLKIVKSESDDRALEALWALNQLGAFDVNLALELLGHRDQHIRRWTIRLLGDSHQMTNKLAQTLVQQAKTEPYAEVRSQLASSAKRFPAEAGLAITAELLQREEDLEDLHIPLLLWWAIESKATSDRDVVLRLFSRPDFWQVEMVKNYILERIMQRYAMAGGDENYAMCAKLLKLAPSAEHKQKLMVGMLEAFRGQKIDNLPEELSKGLAEYQKTLGESDLALALRLGDKAATSRALKIIADKNADRPTRLTYIEILGQLKTKQAIGPLTSILSLSGSDTHSLKRVALQALMNFNNPSIGKSILGRYHSTLLDEHDVRSTAQRVLASRKAWSKQFLNEINAWRIKANTVPLDVVQQMALHDDPEIKDGIKKHWGKIRGTSPKEKQQEMKRVAKLVKSGGGDLTSGKALFTKSCAVCHTLFGEGGKAGPKLTGYERDNLNFMLLAVVDPSAAIREEFTNFLVVTDDGRTVTGLIDEQTTKTLTLKDVKGQAILINKEEIEELKALDLSLMPDGLTKNLTDQQVKDLFSYIMSRTPNRKK